MKGIFESMFDLNHNGNISPLESAMEFTFLNELLKDDSEVQTELELSGLDPDELEFMDADERREALEDAGLDPDPFGTFPVSFHQMITQVYHRRETYGASFHTKLV